MTSSEQPEPIAPDTAAGGTALLVIYIISCWDFPDADKLLPNAWRITRPIAALKARCRRAGAPVIYANDNRGRWRSDFPALVDLSLECGGTGGAITQALQPARDDYFVLKPSQSALFGTPLELLLGHLEVRRIAVAGVASDQCVLSTVLEARMRSLEVVVPSDCVATQSSARNRTVLRQFEAVHGVSVTAGSRIRLNRRPSP